VLLYPAGVVRTILLTFVFWVFVISVIGIFNQAGAGFTLSFLGSGVLIARLTIVPLVKIEGTSVRILTMRRIFRGSSKLIEVRLEGPLKRVRFITENFSFASWILAMNQPKFVQPRSFRDVIAAPRTQLSGSATQDRIAVLLESRRRSD
jgi:hypothetical protein